MTSDIINNPQFMPIYEKNVALYDGPAQNLTQTGGKSSNEVDTDSLFKMMDLYYSRKGIQFNHLYNSFNKFVDEDVKNILKYGDNTFFEKMTKEKIIKYKLEYDNISIRPPMLDNDEELMFPNDARNRNLTYGAKVIASVTQVQEIIDIATDEVTRVVNGQTEHEVPIATLPIMVKSKFCSLNIKKGYDKAECSHDPGGYFIVNGAEKVVLSLEKMCENKPLVFIKKDASGNIFKVQVNSKSYKTNGLTQIVTVKMKTSDNITIGVPILSEIPVFILFRALGIESDKDIINMIVHDDNDSDMINLIRLAIDNSKNDKVKRILTEADAIEYLIGKLRVIKKYTETDKAVKQKQKRLHLLNLLETNFLPHIEGSVTHKAFFLGLMINKLLQVYLGREKPDDRDSFTNKRIDPPGILIEELFRQFNRKMLTELNKFFKKRNTDDTNPIRVINQIKPNIIEQGLKAALLTGSWGRKKGVAQPLQRLTYLQTLALLRRVDAPSVDASTSKLTNPRYYHVSQTGFLCVTGDTEVLLSDGITVKQIKDFTNADTVVVLDNKTLKEGPSGINNYFSKMADKLLKVTTISGREIKCTPEHPLMIRRNDTYEYVNAINLKIGDMVITRHTQKYLPIDKVTKCTIDSKDLNLQYKTDLIKLGLTDRNLNQEQLEITARLVGASVTDGNITISKEGYYSCEFSVGEEADVFALIRDINTLGFGHSSVDQRTTYFNDKINGKSITYNTWRVTKNGPFAYYLASMGTFTGKKTTQARKVPDWIMNANLRIKREFLSAFQGGDGCRLSMNSNNSLYKLHMSTTSQVTIEKYLTETMNYMQQIVQLFQEFEIKCKVSNRIMKDNTDIDTDIESIEKGNEKIIKYQTIITFEQTLPNLNKYGEYIGYRYCQDKQRFSAPVIEYMKYKTKLIADKQASYAKIIALHTQGVKQSYILKQTGIKAMIIKRIISDYNKGIVPQPKCDVIVDYESFCKQYYIKDNKLSVPIQSIEEIAPELVYDFSTDSDQHNFIANGLQNHNCPIESPEHSKVGLVKHLTLISSITIAIPSQIPIIKNLIISFVTDLMKTSPQMLRTYTKVFLNGDWLGLTDKPFEIVRLLKQKKLHGGLDNTVGISHDIGKKDIRIYTDGGRLYRPVLRVENNLILLKKSDIDQISLNKSDQNKVTSWDQFLLKNQGKIENIDVEEQYFAMIAQHYNDIDTMYERMNKSVDLARKNKMDTVINRYDDMSFIRYTHSEIHPSFLIGVLATNIPYCNHNQGPRNIFQYAQGKQAMGIYATSYRDRLDISYILYHPSRPLISTRTLKYSGSDIMTCGENAVVAIACYTGLIVAHVIAKTMASLHMAGDASKLRGSPL